MEMQEFPGMARHSVISLGEQQFRSQMIKSIDLQRIVIILGKVTLCVYIALGVIFAISGAILLYFGTKVGHTAKDDYQVDPDEDESKQYEQCLKQFGVLLIVLSPFSFLVAVMGFKLISAAKERDTTKLHNLRAIWILADLAGIVAIILAGVITQNFYLLLFLFIYLIAVVRLVILSRFINLCFDSQMLSSTDFVASPQVRPGTSRSTFRQLNHAD